MHGPWIPLGDGGFVIIDDPLPPGSEWGLVVELHKTPEESDPRVTWRTRMPS